MSHDQIHDITVILFPVTGWLGGQVGIDEFILLQVLKNEPQQKKLLPFPLEGPAEQERMSPRGNSNNSVSVMASGAIQGVHLGITTVEK